MRRRGRKNPNKLRLGDHNVISDISGFKHKASEMRILEGEQKGLLVHKSEWNPEHPQLHLRAREDRQSVENVRLRPPDTFTESFNENSLTNLKLWLDASDEDNFVKDANENIEAWNDLSSQGNDFGQLTTSLKPVYSATGLSGNNTVIYNQDYLDSSNDFLTEDSYTFFIVTKFSSIATEMLAAQGSSASFSIVITGTLTSFVVTSGATLSASVTTPTSKANEGIVISAKIDASAKTITYRVNGVEQTDFDAGYMVSGFTGSDPLRLGDGFNGGIPGMLGNVSEFLVYEGAKTAAEIQDMENYLTTKWLIL